MEQKERSQRTKDNLAKFIGTCKVCGHNLKFIENTNVSVCTNPNCGGYTDKRTDKEGNEYVHHEPVAVVMPIGKADRAMSILKKTAKNKKSEVNGK